MTIRVPFSKPIDLISVRASTGDADARRRAMRLAAAVGGDAPPSAPATGPMTPVAPGSIDPVLFAKLTPATQQALYDDLTRLGLDTSRLVLPAAPAVAASVRASRGRAPTGLTADEAAGLDRAMGIVAQTRSGATIDERGTLTTSAITPTEWRARRAAGKGRAA